MSYNQYRITVNSAQSEVLNVYPQAQWSRIAELYEARGCRATFERRLITSPSILLMIPDALSRGYMRIDDAIVCPWEVIAEMV